MSDDTRYLKTIVDSVRVCAKYKPKFGQGKGGGLTLDQFQALYSADRFYGWFGLDNPLMYAAHKAAGGMTSIYRQIGIGCEKVFRQILQDSLGLAAEDVIWSYQTDTADGKSRKLSLDGRVPIERITDAAAKERFRAWMQRAAENVGVDRNALSLKGAVFEVRQGYKSKDSKRQNADIANAAEAYIKGYLPCAIILSAQIDGDIVARYRNNNWTILTGVGIGHGPLVSTYDFMNDVIGYDLASFFSRNSKALKVEVDAVLRALLKPDTP